MSSVAPKLVPSYLAAPPPLPPRKNTTSKTNLARTTTLLNIAKHTDPTFERIDPYLTPPWRRTARSFGPRVSINPHKHTGGTPKNIMKTKAAATHNRLLTQLTTSPNTLTIYTDGALKNMSPFRRVGAGLVGYIEGAEVFTRKMGLGGHAEAYDAEMAALCLAAHHARQYMEENPHIRHIYFFTDNTSAISAIFNPKNSPGQLYAHTFHRLMCNFLDNDEQNTINISWCPSHSDITGNDRADSLAKEACELGLSAPITTTRSYSLRRAKALTLQAWTKEWSKGPRRGGYAISNRFPPSLKVTPHFKALRRNRELFGRLIQCRTGHAYTGEYRKKFIPNAEESNDCSCEGNPPHTREHVLLECPLYEDHRYLLREASRDISLPVILGTRKGLIALTQFLQDSGAFTCTGNVTAPRPLPEFEDEPEPPDDYDSDGGAED